MREALGAARWSKLVTEAGERAEKARLAVHAAMPTAAPDAAEELLDRATFDRLPVEERRAVLRSLVQAVFARSGDGPLSGRVDVVGHDVVLDIPRTGRRGVARRWEGLV